jgi:hypothetical protein
MLLHGPSDGLKAWTKWLEEQGDWCIDARKRWHEGDPPPAPTPKKRHAIRTGIAIVSAIVVGLHFAGYLPPPEHRASPARASSHRSVTRSATRMRANQGVT